MNITLKRTEIGSMGAFGRILEIDLFTLEHAYPVGLSDFAPKVPGGTYTCVRGVHQLLDRPPFETFQIRNVPGHVGILFHCGNTENDSEGCILLGLYKSANGIIESRSAFSKFMKLQEGVNDFEVTILAP